MLMRWSDISFAPETKTLRQFAGFWILFLGGLACWHGLVRGNIWLAMVFAVLALAVGPLGLIRPHAIRPIYVAAMILAFPRYNKKWWLLPIMVVILLLGVLVFLGSTGAAPFIYTLF